MSFRHIMLAVAFTVAGTTLGQEGPTMGWSSWNTFGVNISESIVAALVNGCYLLVKDLEELNGTKRAFAVYNPNDAQKTVQVSFADLDMGGLVN